MARKKVTGVQYQIDVQVTGVEKIKQLEQYLKNIQKNIVKSTRNSVKSNTWPRVYNRTGSLQNNDITKEMRSSYAKFGSVPTFQIAQHMHDYVNSLKQIFDEQMLVVMLSNKVIADSMHHISTLVNASVRPSDVTRYTKTLSEAMQRYDEEIAKLFENVNLSQIVKQTSQHTWHTAKIAKPQNMLLVKKGIQEKITEVFNMPELQFALLTDIVNITEIQDIIEKSWDKDIETIKQRIRSKIKIPAYTKATIHDVAQALEQWKVMYINFSDTTIDTLLNAVMKFGKDITKSSHVGMNMLTGIIDVHGLVKNIEFPFDELNARLQDISSKLPYAIKNAMPRSVKRFHAWQDTGYSEQLTQLKQAIEEEKASLEHDLKVLTDFRTQVQEKLEKPLQELLVRSKTINDVTRDMLLGIYGNKTQLDESMLNIWTTPEVAQAVDAGVFLAMFKREYTTVKNHVAKKFKEFIDKGLYKNLDALKQEMWKVATEEMKYLLSRPEQERLVKQAFAKLNVSSLDEVINYALSTSANTDDEVVNLLLNNIRKSKQLLEKTVTSVAKSSGLEQVLKQQVVDESQAMKKFFAAWTGMRQGIFGAIGLAAAAPALYTDEFKKAIKVHNAAFQYQMLKQATKLSKDRYAKMPEEYRKVLLSDYEVIAKFADYIKEPEKVMAVLRNVVKNIGASIPTEQLYSIVQQGIQPRKRGSVDLRKLLVWYHAKLTNAKNKVKFMGKTYRVSNIAPEIDQRVTELQKLLDDSVNNVADSMKKWLHDGELFTVNTHKKLKQAAQTIAHNLKTLPIRFGQFRAAWRGKHEGKDIYKLRPDYNRVLLPMVKMRLQYAVNNISDEYKELASILQETNVFGLEDMVKPIEGLSDVFTPIAENGAKFWTKLSNLTKKLYTGTISKDEEAKLRNIYKKFKLNKFYTHMPQIDLSRLYAENLQKTLDELGESIDAGLASEKVVGYVRGVRQTYIDPNKMLRIMKGQHLGETAIYLSKLSKALYNNLTVTEDQLADLLKLEDELVKELNIEGKDVANHKPDLSIKAPDKEIGNLAYSMSEALLSRWKNYLDVFRKFSGVNNTDEVLKRYISDLRIHRMGGSGIMIRALGATEKFDDVIREKVDDLLAPISGLFGSLRSELGEEIVNRLNNLNVSATNENYLQKAQAFRKAIKKTLDNNIKNIYKLLEPVQNPMGPFVATPLNKVADITVDKKALESISYFRKQINRKVKFINDAVNKYFSGHDTSDLRVLTLGYIKKLFDPESAGVVPEALQAINNISQVTNDLAAKLKVTQSKPVEAAIQQIESTLKELSTAKAYIDSKPLSELFTQYEKVLGKYKKEFEALIKADDQLDEDLKQIYGRMWMELMDVTAGTTLDQMPFDVEAIAMEKVIKPQKRRIQELLLQMRGTKGAKREALAKELTAAYLELIQQPIDYVATFNNVMQKYFGANLTSQQLQASIKDIKKVFGIRKADAERFVQLYSSGATYSNSKEMREMINMMGRAYLEKVVAEWSNLGAKGGKVNVTALTEKIAKFEPVAFDYAAITQQILGNVLNEIVDAVMNKKGADVITERLGKLKELADISKTGLSNKLTMAYDEMLSGMFKSAMDSAKAALSKTYQANIKNEIENMLRKHFKSLDINTMYKEYAQIMAGESDLTQIVKTQLVSQMGKYKKQLVEGYVSYFEEWQGSIVSMLESSNLFSPEMKETISNLFKQRIEAIKEALETEMKNVMSSLSENVDVMTKEMAKSALIDKWKRASVEVVMSALSVVMTFSIISSNFKRLEEEFDKLERYARSLSVMLRTFNGVANSVFSDFIHNAENTIIKWAANFGFEMNDTARALQEAAAQSDNLNEMWIKINTAVAYARATGSTFEQALKQVGAAMEGDVRSLKKLGRALGMELTPSGKMKLDESAKDRLVKLVGSVYTNATYWANKLQMAKMQLGQATDDVIDAYDIWWSRLTTHIYESFATSDKGMVKGLRNSLGAIMALFRGFAAKMSSMTSTLLSIYALMGITSTLWQYLGITLKTFITLFTGQVFNGAAIITKLGAVFRNAINNLVMRIVMSIKRGITEAEAVSIAAKAKIPLIVGGIAAVFTTVLVVLNKWKDRMEDFRKRLDATQEMLNQSYKKYMGKIKPDDVETIGQTVIDTLMQALTSKANLQKLQPSKLQYLANQISDYDAIDKYIMALPKFADDVQSFLHYVDVLTGNITGDWKQLDDKTKAALSEIASLDVPSKAYIKLYLHFKQLVELQKEITDLAQKHQDYTSQYNKGLEVVSRIKQELQTLMAEGTLRNIDVDTIVEELSKALSPSRAMQTQLGQMLATWQGITEAEDKLEDQIKRTAQTSDSLLNELLSLSKEYYDSTFQFQKSAMTSAMQAGLKYFKVFYDDKYKELAQRAKKNPYLAKYLEYSQDAILTIMKTTYYKSLGIWQDWSVKIGNYQENMLSNWAKNLLKYGRDIQGDSINWKEVWKELFNIGSINQDDLVKAAQSIDSNVKTIKDHVLTLKEKDLEPKSSPPKIDWGDFSSIDRIIFGWNKGPTPYPNNNLRLELSINGVPLTINQTTENGKTVVRYQMDSEFWKNPAWIFSPSP